jgi:hypothetical protein
LSSRETSAEMWVIVPLISGVVRWLKAEKRSPAAWPRCS